MKMKEAEGSEASVATPLSSYRSGSFAPESELDFTVQLTAADSSAEDFFKPEPKKPKKADPKVLLEQTEQENKFIQIENELFKQHIMRVSARAAHEARLRLDDMDSDDGYTMTDLDSVSIFSRSTNRSRGARSSMGDLAIEGVKRANLMFRSPSFSVTDFSRISTRFSRSSTKEVHEKPFRPMTNEEKIQMARAEIRILNDQLQALKNDNNRTCDDLQALYEEAEIRIARVRRDKSDFQRDVLTPSPSRRAVAETVIRFLERKMKDTRISTKKTKEHNEALQYDIVKTETCLEDKQDIKDLIQPIDFDQMAILNKQVLNSLRGCVAEIQRRKLILTTSSKTLLNLKNELASLDSEVIRIRHTIADRLPRLEDVKKDVKNNTIALERLQEELHQLLIQEIHGVGQPHVLEYMHAKIKLQELNRTVNNWRRKTEIAKFTLDQLNKKISKLHRRSSFNREAVAYNAAYAAHHFHSQMLGTR